MDSDSDIEVVATQPAASQAPKRTQPTSQRPKPSVLSKLPSLSPDPLEKILKRPAQTSFTPVGSFKDNGRSTKRAHQSASASVPPPLLDSSLSPVPSSPAPPRPKPSSSLSSPELPQLLRFSPLGRPRIEPTKALSSSSGRSSPPPDPVPGSKSTTNRTEKQAQAAQARLLREAKKAAKEKEKLDNKLQRDANKLTLNRKETVSEVRMYIPKTVKKSKLHPLTKAVEVFEQRITTTEGCMMHQPMEIDDESSDSTQAVVRWVRTSTKEWDEERGIFVPLGIGITKETSEPTVLVVWTGKEVDELIASGVDQLTKKAQSIKSCYPDDQLLIVIHGLETILKAERRQENALKDQEARARLAAQRNEPLVSTTRNKTAANLPQNSREKILKELEILKIRTKAFVIRVEEKNEFANWLWEMTMEIGVRPYKSRKQEIKSALRLDQAGNKGANNEDTYIKMLSSLTRVTENEAKGIVAKFPTLKCLYQSWERGIEKNGRVWAEDMLVGCSKSNAITGVNSNRKIGKVTSKRIFDIMFQTKNGDAVL